MSHSSPSPGWTDARVDILTRLWRSGLCASQIARSLGGVTRNAVIGKAHRLGLSGRATPRPARPVRATRAPARLPRSRIRAEMPRSAGATRMAELEISEVGAISDLAALAADACRWPIGDPRAANFGFCGSAANGAGPYCETHSRRAHRPQTEPLDRDPFLRRLLAGSAR